MPDFEAFLGSPIPSGGVTSTASPEANSPLISSCVASTPTTLVVKSPAGSVQFKAQIQPVTLAVISPEEIAKFRTFIEITQPSDQPARESWINFVTPSARRMLDV